jgi:hypothetical protein
VSCDPISHPQYHTGSPRHTTVLALTHIRLQAQLLGPHHGAGSKYWRELLLCCCHNIAVFLTFTCVCAAYVGDLALQVNISLQCLCAAESSNKGSNNAFFIQLALNESCANSLATQLSEKRKKKPNRESQVQCEMGSCSGKRLRCF